MTRGLTLRLAAATAAAGVALLTTGLTAGPAAASCAAGDVHSYYFQAPHLLRGKVIDSRPGFAQLKVEEIWKGPATEPTIWVQTGEKPASWPFNLIQPQSASSGDITLIVGAHYVLAADDGYRTDNCVVIGADEADRVGLRPTNVIQPLATGQAGAPLPGGPASFLTKTGILAAIVAAGIGAHRAVKRAGRRRRATPAEAAQH